MQRDARNRELGRNGEEWGRVEWVAATRGDGLGYDIESFNRDGSASAPRMYPLTGALDQVCRLEPAVVCGAGGVGQAGLDWGGRKR